jgi:uncharacterized membrane protein
MAQSFNTGIKKVALAYCQLLGVKITGSSLQKDIEENPYYPSLLSLSDTFDRYGIANSAYNIPDENFDELEAPFITLLNTPSVGNDFVLVTEVTDKKVSYRHSGNKPQTIEKEQFIGRFRNFVFLAEPDENSGERDYEEKVKKEKRSGTKKSLWIAAAALILLSVIGANITSSIAITYSFITIIKLAGLVPAVLLLVYEIDKSNAFIKNICSAGAKTNCDAILDSKASKIWGISWAEIGFFYFASTTIWLLIPGVLFAYKTVWLAIGNCFAAPYTVFSVYYQWRIVKQWCPLCLIVQATLAAELAWCLVNFWIPIHSFALLSVAGIMPVLWMIACFIPLVAWYGLKPTTYKS